MQKINISSLKGVSETLLIPLSGRARAHRDFPELEFSDPWASKILEKIEFDSNKYAHDRNVVEGASIRAQILDRVAKKFFEQHPDGHGFSLGAGLCTRFYRIDDGKLVWTDIDLPPVIDLKKRLVPETDRYKFIAHSILDFEWMNLVNWKEGQPVLFIIEGVLLYLLPEEVKNLFQRLVKHFHSGGEIAFDYCHPLVAKYSERMRHLKTSGTRFRWSTKDLHELSEWNPRIKLLSALPITSRTSGLPGIATRIFHKLTGSHLYGAAHCKF